MSRKCIVTGGAGFIGSHLVRELNARGEDDILVVDHLGASDKWKNLVGLRFEEYLDKSALFSQIEAGLLGEVDVVYHLGACSSTTERDADYLMENNYRYTRRLCEACLAADVRFVYASSAATYGDGSLGYSDVDVDTPTYHPMNMYGYSKHLFDLWALKQQLFDRIAGLKFFNVYGQGEAHKGDMRSMVHKAAEQLRATGKVRLFKSTHPEYKDGEQVRDFIYVKDAVNHMLWLGEQAAVSGLFNCGTGTPRTWIDLVAAVGAAIEVEPEIEFIEMPDQLQGQYQNYTAADMCKTRASGYDVTFSRLEDGVLETLGG